MSKRYRSSLKPSKSLLTPPLMLSSIDVSGVLEKNTLMPKLVFNLGGGLV